MVFNFIKNLFAGNTRDRAVSPPPPLPLSPSLLLVVSSPLPFLVSPPPPSLRRGYGSPFTRAPLPEEDTPSQHIPMSTPTIVLNILLLVCFDLNVSRRHLFSHMSDQQALEPASYPVLPSLTITSVYLPWAIDVKPSSGRNFVTVRDVIFAIHDSLQQYVSYEELTAHHAREERDMVLATARQRSAHRHKRAPEDVYIQRVDYLFGATQFMGLRAINSGMGHFELNVAYQ